MADRFYGVAIGGKLPTDVTEDSSTTSAAVELRISDSAYSNKLLVLEALDAIEMYLETIETNPIA
jgi:hypothetical protein